MLGVRPAQLNSWARLGLIASDVRRGEPFYGFPDLVAIETIKRLTAEGIPTRRLKRALSALREQVGDGAASLANLHVTTNGREVVVSSPASGNVGIEPLTGQMVLGFNTRGIAEKIRSLPSRSAEEWFEMGLACDLKPGTMRRAADAYRHAVRLAPEWVEAHINLGTALFHLKQFNSARRCFKTALDLDPVNALAHFNYGCVLERLGHRQNAIDEIERSVTLDPARADAHLNLALLYDQSDEQDRMREHLEQYLRCEPNGRWAQFARSRLPAGAQRHNGGTESRSRSTGISRTSSKVTPFRRP
jgi:tetratricopeptide (TPR) repeat protein